MHARNVMSLNPVSVDADATVAEAAELMRDRRVGFVCVLRQGRLVGVVTDRMVATDCVAEGLDPRETPVEHVMQQPATVDEDETIFAVLDTMRSSGMVRRVPVVNAAGELVGVVSLSDLAAVAKDLVDGILDEELHNSTANARVLTGAKRIVKKIRRPRKAGRLREPPVVAKRQASRPGVQRDALPRRRRAGGPAGQPRQQATQRGESWNRGR
jgi:CBS domain-containing protein